MQCMMTKRVIYSDVLFANLSVRVMNSGECILGLYVHVDVGV